MLSVGEDIYVGKKRSNSLHNRVYFLIGIGLFCVILVTLGITVPLSTIQSLDRKDDLARSRTEFEVADHWASVFRELIIDAVSISYEIDGFVHGVMKSTPPLNGTKEERIKGQSFERFDYICRFMNSILEYRSLFFIAPGGVVLQTFPKIPSMLLLDILDLNFTMKEIQPPEDMWLKKRSIVKPHPFFFTTIGGKCQLAVRALIFDVNTENITDYKFWGFSFVIVDVDAVLEKNNIDAFAKERRVEYIIHTSGEKKGSISPIRHSLKVKNPSESMLNAFLRNGVTRTVLKPRTSLSISVQSMYKEPRLTGKLLLLIVTSALFVSLLLFGVLSAVVFACFRDYDSREHAPKMAPFALVVIGPCGGMEMWDLAPDRMAKVMEKLSALQYRAMVRHTAYESVHAHPFTVTLITRTVDAAIELCYSVLEHLHENPIDEPLRELVGEEGRITVACSVHWCTNATVRMDASTGTLRYEGPDVMYGTRMWLFAVPQQVTISERVRDMVEGNPDTEIQALGAVFLRGVPDRQNIFSITNTTKKFYPMVEQEELRCCASSFSNPLGSENHDCHIPSSAASGSAYANTSATALHSTADVAVEYDSEKKHIVTVVDNPCLPQEEPTDMHARTTLLEIVPQDNNNNNNTQSTVMHNTAPGEKSVCSGILASPRTSKGARLDRLRSSSRDRRRGSSRRGSKNALPEAKRRFDKMPFFLNSDGGSLKASRSGGRSDSGTHTDSQGALREGDPPSGDFVAESLLHPRIPVLTDTHLRDVFEQQLTTLDLSYDSVRIVLYYFYASFKILLKPLAGPERDNIFRRFVIAFGVPQRNTLEHLAVRCGIRYLQHLERSHAIAWNRVQHICFSSKRNTLKTSGEGDNDQSAPAGPHSIY